MEAMDREITAMLDPTFCRYTKDGRHRPQHPEDFLAHKGAEPGHVVVECALCMSTTQVPIPDPGALVWSRGDVGCPAPKVLA